MGGVIFPEPQEVRAKPFKASISTYFLKFPFPFARASAEHESISIFSIPKYLSRQRNSGPRKRQQRGVLHRERVLHPEEEFR